VFKPAGTLNKSNQAGARSQDSSIQGRGRGDSCGCLGEAERGLGDREGFGRARGQRDSGTFSLRNTVPVVRESRI